jgi:hypothetical protein
MSMAMVAWGVLSTIDPSSYLIAAPSKRAIDLEIRLPTGGTPHFIVPEQEGLLVPLPDHRQYGFIPVIRDESNTVIVSVWDVGKDPARRLGDVEAMPGGPAVVSETTPAFGIRVLGIVPSK